MFWQKNAVNHYHFTLPTVNISRACVCVCASYHHVRAQLARNREDWKIIFFYDDESPPIRYSNNRKKHKKKIKRHNVIVFTKSECN